MKTSTGATKGDIPIGYVGTSVDRSGHYYLPKGEETPPCRLASAVHPCVGKGRKVFLNEPIQVAAGCRAHCTRPRTAGLLQPSAVPLIPIPHASAAGYQLKRLPVLVMLHGSGVDGNYIVSHYQSLADKYKCGASPCSAAGPVSCCAQLLCMSLSAADFGCDPADSSSSRLTRTGSCTGALPRTHMRADQCLCIQHASRTHCVMTYVFAVPCSRLAAVLRHTRHAMHAPVCRYSPDKASDPFTEDYWHILACYKYVQKLKNVLFDYK